MHESIILSLVVGLSIDYTVHLAEAYSRSDEKLRKRRLHDTLQTIGISVLSGFLISLGSAICLVPCTLVPLSKFGVRMCAIMCLSFLYAMFYFTTVVALVGPEGDVGSLALLLRKMTRAVKSS